MPAVDTSAASRALTSATKAPVAKTSAGPASTAHASDADDDDDTPDPVVAHTATQAAPARDADNVSTSYLVLAPSTTAVVTRSQVSLAAAFAGPPSSGFILLPSSALAAPAAPTSTMALPTAAAVDDGATASSTSSTHTAGFIVVGLLIALSCVLLPCLLWRRKSAKTGAIIGRPLDPDLIQLPNGKVAVRAQRASRAPGDGGHGRQAVASSVSLSPSRSAVTWTPRCESRQWSPRSESRGDWSSPGGVSIDSTVRAVDMPMPPALRIAVQAPSPVPDSQHASVYSTATPVLGYAASQPPDAPTGTGDWFATYRKHAQA